MANPLITNWQDGNDCGIAKLLGFRMLSVDRDRAVVEFQPGAAHTNPMGSLHGGVFCDIADAAMGMAWISGLEEGETCTTIELKINFLRPIWKTKIIAEGKVVQRGRSVGYVECELRDEAGRVVAKASSTLMTLRGSQAKGR